VEQNLHFTGVSKAISEICKFSGALPDALSIFANCVAVTVNTNSWLQQTRNYLVLSKRHFSIIIATMMLLLHRCKQCMYRDPKH